MRSKAPPGCPSMPTSAGDKRPPEHGPLSGGCATVWRSGSAKDPVTALCARVVMVGDRIDRHIAEPTSTPPWRAGGRRGAEHGLQAAFPLGQIHLASRRLCGGCRAVAGLAGDRKSCSTLSTKTPRTSALRFRSASARRMRTIMPARFSGYHELHRLTHSILAFTASKLGAYCTFEPKTRLGHR